MVAWDIGFYQEVHRGISLHQELLLDLKYLQASLAPLQDFLLKASRIESFSGLKQQFPESWDKFRKLALRFRLIR
jgi:hypothetical protein